MVSSNHALRKKKKKALTFFKTDQLEKARHLYTEICALDGADTDAWYMLGNTNERLGRFDEAVRCCRKVADLMPDSAKAHYNLALGLRGQGHLADAVHSHQRALRLRPDFIESRLHLSQTLRELARHEEAEQELRQVLQLSPDLPDTLFDLAVILSAQGKLAEALATQDRLLQVRPGNEDALAEKARILEKQGDFEAAYQCLRPLIEAGSQNARVAVAFAGLSRHSDRRAEAIKLIECVLEQGKAPEPQQVELHYSAGKLYDELGQFGSAFEHFQQANALTPCYFDKQMDIDLINRLIATYNAERLEQSPQAEDGTELPVFIVGMPRSGTSLVEQILACHPEIFGAGELIDIFDMVESLPAMLGTRQSYPECIKQLSQEMVDKLSQRYLDSLKEKAPTAQRVTNKMPANYWHLGFIQMLFPGARIIHCIRNPLDTCLSCYFQNFGSRHLYSTDLMQLGKYALGYRRMMQHWKNVLRIPVLEVRYEDLVADQEKISRAVIDFCGLEWDARCLRFFESRRVINTASYDQVRRAMYTTSVGRWKNYEAHLEPLITVLNKGAQV